MGTWHTDGKNIYFVSDRDGENALYKMDADGANVTKIKLSNSIFVDYYPAIKISPDNLRVAFECGESGGVICMAKIDRWNCVRVDFINFIDCF